MVNTRPINAVEEVSDEMVTRYLGITMIWQGYVACFAVYVNLELTINLGSKLI